MANTYNLTLTNGVASLVINEKQTAFDHGLTFTGRGVEDYGEHRNTNLLHLAEHFASDTAPTNPLEGQAWYDTGTGTIQVWDGVAWINVVTDDYIISGTYNVSSNQVALPKALTADVVIDNIAQYDEFIAHTTAVSGAHDASRISFDDTGVPFTASDVQEAIEDANTYLDDHLTAGPAPGDPAHNAEDITFSDASVSFTASDVQEAIEDLDSRRATTSGIITAVSNAVTNHINDPVNAHEATAISYDNTTSGLTATDVQAAIDEIATSATSGSGAGIIDYVRAYPTANTLIPSGPLGGAFGTWTTITFNTVYIGDDLSNYNTGLYRYVADRPMEVRIRAYARYDDLGDNQYGNIRIRKNGTTTIRRGFIIKLASSVNLADQTIEISVIDELSTNDYIEVQGSIQSYDSGYTASRNIVSGRANTGFEIEVLKDNSP